MGLAQPQVDGDGEALGAAQAGNEGLGRPGTAARNCHMGRVDALEERGDLLARRVEYTNRVVEGEQGF